MTDKFEVKINCERGIYYLATTRNGYQWTSVPMYTTGQMRRIAAALVAKADEIELKITCPDCHNSNVIRECVSGKGIYYTCLDCKERSES